MLHYDSTPGASIAFHRMPWKPLKPPFNGFFVMTFYHHSLCRLAISLFPLALIHSYHKNHNLLIDHLVDQSVAATAQLDLVAVRQAM